MLAMPVGVLKRMLETDCGKTGITPRILRIARAGPKAFLAEIR